MRQADRSPYSVEVVERTLDLLEVLVRQGPAPLAGLAEQAGCTPTAAFRLLRTLEARGYAAQDGARGAWRLGSRWGQVGRAAADQQPLDAVARPFLERLAGACGENVYLHRLQDSHMTTVDIAIADPAIRRYATIGDRQPLHAGPGRLLLAYAPEPLQLATAGGRLRRFTPATRTDATWLLAELQRIRARGWLVTSDEVELGEVTLGAPVRDASGAVIAALTIRLPALRLRSSQARATLLGLVQQIAAELTAALGGKADQP
jgi:DNA-binding IclR family transcriptional regulator